MIRIVDVREVTKPIASPIRNAYIDFSKMTTSLVAVVTDAKVDGHTVVGYGFNSNGRYGQGGLIRERFAPRLLEADPQSLLNDTGDNIDPHKAWGAMMQNEKPGGHGERSVAVGTLDMAIWDAVAKIARNRFRVYEVPISYNGRTYEEGKKITWRDGAAALWFILNVPNDPDALPPVLDLEWNGHSRSCPKRIPVKLALEKIS